MALLLLVTTTIGAQQKRLTMEEVLKWNRITESAISPDGKKIAVILEPWRGPSKLKLYDNRGVQLFEADSAKGISFLEEPYLLYTSQREGGYSLSLYSLITNRVNTFENVKSHSLTKEQGGRMVALLKDSLLISIELSSHKGGPVIDTLSKGVTKYNCNSNYLVMATKNSLIKLELQGSTYDTIYRGQRELSALSLAKEGGALSFVIGDSLYLYTPVSGVHFINNELSAKEPPYFSPDGSKLYYTIKRELPRRDSTLTKEEFPKVDIWNWNEGRQFTQQKIELQKDKNRGELVVYTLEKGSSYRVTNENVSAYLLAKGGDSQKIALLSDTPYQLESMWSGRAKFDLYIADTYLERLSLVLRGGDGSPKFSPESNYLYWYSAPDSSWVLYDLPLSEYRVLTPPSLIKAYQQENDLPDWPEAYGFAGWSKGDSLLYIYDKYDIWEIDPTTVNPPKNITKNGRELQLSYRYNPLNKQENHLDCSKGVLLTAFNLQSKGYGYYKLDSTTPLPQKLIGGDYMLGAPVKSSKSDAFIYTRESYREFPDIRYSSDLFKSSIKITNANSAQSNFLWGEAKLVKWHSSDGVELEGVLYTPQNFDPTKKYPLIVNFYERNSHTLHSYRTPEPHRSTIDYHMYNSDGYLVFNPDIVYKEGYPGESAYNAVMPAISKLIEEGYVDPKRIGAQGHSWGGYQVAYLATRTNLFAAIESGAPVVNMFSAYGGIRWGSGLNRSFQYEHQQSRIGKTPWEAPLRYIENSPLFAMDKVTTPILIMHNDNDGHVPWYQGIEFFVALKRLRKPTWLLNYTGEIHWPQQLKNKVDFQIRMKQFFDHYLKGAPAPQWMEPGVSAIELENITGY